MDSSKLSSYQNPEGTLKDRLAPRTDLRLKMFKPDWFNYRTVLDLGCNNGYFTRYAMKSGALRAVGVDESDAVIGARELAKQEGVNAEFWQTDLDGVEFRKYCPRFEVVLLFSVLTHLKNKEEFLEWLDDKVMYRLIFESNHGEPNKKHIDLVTKYMYFENVEYLGASDIPSKPHYMWVCTKANHEIRYPLISKCPIEFVPVDKITGWTEETILNQKTKYDLQSEKFQRLKADIKQRGIREPLIVEQRRGGVIVGFQGAHRYMAAKQLGYKDVPCRVLSGKFFKHLK